MHYVYYETPTRTYLKFEGNYEDCKKYLTENKLTSKEHNSGYFLTIRDHLYTCLLRDSNIK